MIYKHLNHNNSPIITANNRLKGQQYYISSSKKTLSICQKYSDSKQRILSQTQAITHCELRSNSVTY